METSISFKFKNKSFNDAIYHFNNPLNNGIDDPDQKEKWLKILQLFFYSKGVDKYPTIINKVLNYLYTGKLGNGNFTDQTDDLLIIKKERAKITSHFGDMGNREHLIKKKNFFLDLYILYLKVLNDYFSEVNVKEPCKTYGKILIYEAPPFKKETSVVDHFLLNGGTYLNAIIEASPGKQFIEKIRAAFQKQVKDFTKKFSYYSKNFKKTSVLPPEIIRFFNPESLKNNEEEENRNNIIEELIKKYPHPHPEDFKEKIRTYLEELIALGEKRNKRFKRDEKRIWKEFFNTLIEQDELFLNLEKAVTSEIVYIDLILAPIHIDSELRKAWSTKDEFLFENKQLPVILFEWAIEHFKYKIRDLRGDKSDPKQLVSTNCLIAFGTPLNTSVSIYEHFVDKMFLIDTYGPETQRKENHIDLTQLNSPVAFRKFKNRGQGVVFPMFKSNVIGGSRYPDSMLVKHAFDIEDKEKT